MGEDKGEEDELPREAPVPPLLHPAWHHCRAFPTYFPPIVRTAATVVDEMIRKGRKQSDGHSWIPGDRHNGHPMVEGNGE